MFLKLNNFLKSFFTLNKGEQKGIVVLFVLVFVVAVLNMLLPFFIENDKSGFSDYKNEIAVFRKERGLFQDSVEIKKRQKKGDLTKEEALLIIKPFVFDPNTLDEQAWLKMGFSPRQYQSINNYLSKGGRFRKPVDLKKMYCISQAEFDLVEPFIVIEGQTETGAIKRKRKTKTKSVNEYYKKTNKPKVIYIITELNSADSANLVSNLKLYPSIASRVVKYKNKLGGFYKKEQLLEVYKFPKTYFNKIKSYLEVDSSKIEMMNINSIAFKQLLKHPYFDYETTKLIFNKKPKKGKMYYSGFQELKDLTGINDSIAERIKHYLYFGSPK